MFLYKFGREALARVINDERFLEGVRIAVGYQFVPNREYFRGEEQLLAPLISAPPEDYYSYLSDYSLPYISFCEDPEAYAARYGESHWTTKNIRCDVETREMLLKQAQNKCDPAWWCYIHACEVQALFITYGMCRILWPEQQFYLYSGAEHKVIINRDTIADYQELKYTEDPTQPCTFDPITQLLGDTLHWIFDEPTYSRIKDRAERIIPPEKMLAWYYSNYDYEGMDIGRMNSWFASLP